MNIYIFCSFCISVNCTITNFSQNHIDVKVDDLLIGKWRLNGFYWMPKIGRRKESWAFLRNLAGIFRYHGVLSETSMTYCHQIRR